MGRGADPPLVEPVRAAGASKIGLEAITSRPKLLSAVGRMTSVKIADFIRAQVLHLNYSAHDLAPFARDLGHLNTDGSVKPLFVWKDEDRRLRLAALDGLFMHLYGLSESDAACILDTFPIVREQDMAAFGRYRTKDDVLAQLRRVSSGGLAL